MEKHPEIKIHKTIEKEEFGCKSQKKGRKKNVPRNAMPIWV